MSESEVKDIQAARMLQMIADMRGYVNAAHTNEKNDKRACTCQHITRSLNVLEAEVAHWAAG